ncbi:MAG: replication initiator protein A [Oscillospiraceae bacterium]|nr:replication initiator protein A [Oscillospiraceae bacterium]
MTTQNNTISEAAAFYRLPKLLFTDSCYQELSLSAKMLYALLLDRLSLSARNDWQDEDERVFIYFTMTEAQSYLDCGHSKMIRLFAELESRDLIERKRQGQGKPMKIYVKNLIEEVSTSENQTAETECFEDENAAEIPEMSGKQQPVQPESILPECFFSAVQTSQSDEIDHAAMTDTSEKELSGLPETIAAEVSKPDANKTENNNTEMNDINPIFPPYIPPFEPSGEEDSNDSMDGYRKTIKANIDYEILLADHPDDQELIDSYIELMAETCASKRQTIRINREELPIETVRSRFLKLNGEHIGYVLECMKHTTASIGNIRGYLLAALYNAPLTMSQYYTTLVSRDFAQEAI